MKIKLVFPFIFAFIGLTTLWLTAFSGRETAVAQANAAAFQRGTPAGSDSGIISTDSLMLFGPNICVNYGDPFSPLNSPWAPGPYTYRFQIRIPADYPRDVVRVELFDPDSINQITNTHTIQRTDAAVNAGLTAVESKSCGTDGGYPDRKHPCWLFTDETSYTGAPVGGLRPDQVNPFWLARIDENRGGGAPPGNGNCGSPSSYNPAFNTATLYELGYDREESNGTVTRVTLSRYTGQTGDGVRDNGDHNTDMRWVSPGAEISFGWDFDQPGIDAPTDPGSTTGFEIDLTQDTPGIVVNPDTGARYLWLDVTALSGASLNGFSLWAGPPDYVNTVPSDVNARNVYLLNNPGARDSAGVTVEALEYLPQKSLAGWAYARPLLTLGPEMAGQTIQVSAFDIDAGSQPPITFYLDTMAESDWSMTFGMPGVDDPDGVPAGTRCTPGSCPTQWISPSYTITLPALTAACDYANPDPQVCTPFYGGRLMARFDVGNLESFVYQVSVITDTAVSSPAACSAFPIGVQADARSVLQANYPDAGEFDNPSPPAYGDFPYHTPDVPLPDAQRGDVFLLETGLGSGNFGWLVWNEYINPSANTLANSLTWPGDSADYSDHGDGGPIPPGFGHVVRGFIEAGDPTDTEMQMWDWVQASTGSVNSNVVRTALDDHIANGRTLRLPVWSVSQQQGLDAQFQISGFALFRIAGYRVSASPGWILLEFVNWDTSCGQTLVGVSAVSLDGATAVKVRQPVTITAAATPLTATQPITYAWTAGGQPPITHTTGVTDTAVWQWAAAGTYTVTVTADNGAGMATAVHTVSVENYALYLPGILK